MKIIVGNILDVETRQNSDINVEIRSMSKGKKILLLENEIKKNDLQWIHKVTLVLIFMEFTRCEEAKKIFTKIILSFLPLSPPLLMASDYL